MISWLGMQFMTTISGYAGGVVAYVMQFLAPIALALLTAWISLYGYGTLRGAVSDPLPEFAWSFFCKLLIVLFATNAAIYHGWVIDVQRSLSLDVAKQFAPAGSPLRNAVNIWGFIETFNDRASELTAMIAVDGVFSTTFLPSLISLLFFSVGNAALIAASMLVAMVTDGFNAFLLGIGPIFILFLLFDVSRQWFVNWLGSLLGMTVLTWLMFFLLGFSLSLTEKVVATMVPNLGNVNVLTQAIIYAAMCGVWCVMLWVAPSFVNGLTGGAALSMGGQMLTQVLMLMRGGKKGGNTNNNDNGNGGGNSASRSPGFAYRAGAALGGMTGVKWAFQSLAERGRTR